MLISRPSRALNFVSAHPRSDTRHPYFPWLMFTPPFPASQPQYSLFTRTCRVQLPRCGPITGQMPWLRLIPHRTRRQMRPCCFGGFAFSPLPYKAGVRGYITLQHNVSRPACSVQVAAKVVTQLSSCRLSVKGVHCPCISFRATKISVQASWSKDRD